MKELDGIMDLLKWKKIAQDYFGFSQGWLCQRLNGYDGNGRPCEFTETQRETMREALRDVARKLNETADKI